MGLNAKQQLFVKEYLKDKNATRSYIAAGYSKKGASVGAHKLLRNANVKKLIEKSSAKQLDKIEVTVDRILEELASIGFAKLGTVKNSDKLKSLELLGKYRGMFKEVHEHSGSNGGPIAYIAVPPNGSEAPNIPSPATPINEISADH